MRETENKLGAANHTRAWAGFCSPFWGKMLFLLSYTEQESLSSSQNRKAPEHFYKPSAGPLKHNPIV